jgi:hypothetical protein
MTTLTKNLTKLWNIITKLNRVFMGERPPMALKVKKTNGLLSASSLVFFTKPAINPLNNPFGV